jgi:hypothetical protein
LVKFDDISVLHPRAFPKACSENFFGTAGYDALSVLAVGMVSIVHINVTHPSEPAETGCHHPRAEI